MTGSTDGSSPSLTEQIVRQMMRPVDAETIARARLHLLDWLGCVVGARRGEAAAAFAESAFVSRAAALGNVLEMDDVHRRARLHPGPVVWPVALACPTAAMAPLLAAAVRGYEAMIAVGASFDARHYAHYHPTATAGGIGAAGCAAAAAGVDAAVLAHALSLAGSVSGGVWQTRHSVNLAKQWHVVHAVSTGMAAAAAALQGVTGPLDVLEGEQGLFAAMCDRPLATTFADGWRIADVSVKPWGACRHAHPAIDAALALRERGALAGPIMVETFADALAFCDRPDPTTVLEAKFSLQHAVAIVAERGEPALADFEPDAIRALADARQRVTLREAADITARYPRHFGARVSAAGATVDLVDTRGDPERPLGQEGVIAKAAALFAWGGLDHAQAARGIDLALGGDDPAALIAWLRAAL